MTIQKVTVADAAALLEIYTPYVQNTAVSFEYDVPSLTEFENRISAISAKLPYLKAVEDGNIIGYAYANTFKGRRSYDWAVEVTIYVHRDRKRQGVGQALYAALETALREMGIQNMNACIAVPRDDTPYLNDDSFRFHQKMGFQLVGTFHQCAYKFCTWFDMIWMEKSIGDHPTHPSAVLFGQWSV